MRLYDKNLISNDMARYIKLHDSILQWQWFHDANTLRLWIYLLLNAQYADGNQLKRGQMMISQRMLYKNLQISYKTLRRSLDALISSGCITVSIVDYSGSLITICNYDKYQGVCSNSNTPVCSNSYTPYVETPTPRMPKLQQGVCPNSNTYTEEEKEIYKEKEERERRTKRYAEVVRDDKIWTEQLAMRLHTTTDVICRGIDEALQTFILDDDLPADLSNFKLRTRQYIDTHIRTIIRPLSALAVSGKTNDKLTSATDYERELFLAAGVEI